MGPLSQRFGMSLLGHVLSPHLGWSSFSQRHCWATTVHASRNNLFFYTVLFASGQGRAPAWLYTAHTPLPSPGVGVQPPWGAPAFPHLSVFDTTLQQHRIGFVFTPNRVFFLSLSLLAEPKSEKYIDLRN